MGRCWPCPINASEASLGTCHKSVLWGHLGLPGGLGPTQQRMCSGQPEATDFASSALPTWCSQAGMSTFECLIWKRPSANEVGSQAMLGPALEAIQPGTYKK